MAELSFRVPGMTRGDCVKALSSEIRKLGGISGVEIDLYTKWVVVTADRIDSEAIRDVVVHAGYEAEL